MQFIVIGYDGRDTEAPARRLAARPAHLDLFADLFTKGTFLFGSAILDDAGQMIGSLIVCEFSDREQLEKQWLQHEPYVTGKVWQTVEVRRAQVPSVVAARLAAPGHH